MAQRSKRWLTAEDICSLLAVGGTRFKELVEAGQFPEAVTLGKGDQLQRWLWQDVAAYMHLRSRHLAALDPRGPPVAQAQEQQPNSPKDRRR